MWIDLPTDCDIHISSSFVRLKCNEMRHRVIGSAAE